MKFYEYDTIDSTSLQAKRLGEKGVVTPFAVFAREQTAGRGQQGKSWESPEGNLYLTIALPGEGLTLEEVGLFPMRALWVCLKWLKQETGVQFRFKWPNDILFGGRKIAGILCESQVRGDEIQRVYVGVGINLTSHPQGPELRYGATDLEEVSGQKINPQDAFERFMKHFSSTLSHVTSVDALSLLKDDLERERQLWVREKLVFEASLEETGSLLLRDPLTGHKFLETNASLDGLPHACLDAPEFLIDMGNTSFKVAFYDGEYLVQRFDYTEDGFRDLVGFLAEKEATQKNRVIYASSVVPDAAKKLEKHLSKNGWILRIVSKMPVRMTQSHYNLEEMGADRMMLIEGWLSYRRSVNAILVSAGTAMTVDLVDATGVHLGGYIVPGLRTSLNSMHQKTERLGDYPLQEDSGESIPHSTKEAMVYGCQRMAVDFIRARSKDFSHQNAELTVVITGGNAHYLASLMPDAQVLPNIILDGIRSVSRGGIFLP